MRGPDRHEVRTAEHAVEPESVVTTPTQLAALVEDANRDAEVEVPVVEAEHTSPGASASTGKMPMRGHQRGEEASTASAKVRAFAPAGRMAA